jgi:cellulose synthase operon protein C
MKLLLRPLLLACGLMATRLLAQIADPSPLVGSTAVATTAPGNWIVAAARADQALHAGFPATAAISYQEILRDPALPAEARARLSLGRVTALLDAGELGEAEKSLLAYDGPRNSAYQLRVGLLAASARRLAPARAALAAGKIEELPPADRGWWYFLQAAVADADNDIERRNRAYDEAGKAAVSDLQRARFALGQEQARLRSGALNEAQLTVLRDNMERFSGTRTGYDAVRTYAAALNGLGRAAEAQALLQRQLAVLPASERNVADQLRLVLGLISGEHSIPSGNCSGTASGPKRSGSHCNCSCAGPRLPPSGSNCGVT